MARLPRVCANSLKATELVRSVKEVETIMARNGTGHDLLLLECSAGSVTMESLMLSHSAGAQAEGFREGQRSVPESPDCR